MSPSTDNTPPVRTAGLWRWATIILALALAGTAGRVVGRNGPGQSAATGYDIGRAEQPRATGQVREFNLAARPAAWELVPGVSTSALTYNGQVPGPTIRVTEGDTLRVHLSNELDQPTSIHWHGLHVPNAMDGVPPFTQAPIAPGQRFTYEFPASHAGTFMYHSHVNSVEQIDRGLYGVLIIDPASPPATTVDAEFTMMLSAWNTLTAHGGAMAMDYNYFTINGKAFPAAPAWNVAPGALVRVRLINISNLVHPMHLHGFDFAVVAKDGEPIRPELQQTMNTLAINAGETYDIIFRATANGTWMFHCHELHHTENDGVEPGGLMQVIQVGPLAPTGATGAPATAPTATPMPANMPGMKH